MAPGAQDPPGRGIWIGCYRAPRPPAHCSRASLHDLLFTQKINETTDAKNLPKCLQNEARNGATIHNHHNKIDLGTLLETTPKKVSKSRLPSSSDPQKHGCRAIWASTIRFSACQQKPHKNDPRGPYCATMAEPKS